ncbi:MAG: metallophosphoesterase [Chloroflexi bacterium]|nr:metallophosphoesterase [Chloroflexota bacterium]MCI0579460.1 metallophosphoesterase [Chloroflexota bacterium]MCI0644913.1 metallophosphoesterase [Chloroflexota bacterium]MCI0729681.1 metallophosphoesterase [Chloroflexota bacterium]
MKLLFVTDLHGSPWKYEHLLGAAQAAGAVVVVNGGDMLPKHGDLFAGQKQFIGDTLDRHFAQFDAAGIHYLCYPGNDDLRIHDGLFVATCAKYPRVVNLAQRLFSLGEYEFVGLNWIVDYPFRFKDRCRMDTAGYVFQEQYGTGLLSTPGGWQDIPDWFAYARTLPTIAEELRRLPRPRNMAQSVYILHMPPANLGLDKCGYGPEVGSQAIYDFLADNQPRLSLHGHIHESPESSGRWWGRVGETVCIQPGQLEPFTYVIIDLETMQFERHV